MRVPGAGTSVSASNTLAIGIATARAIDSAVFVAFATAGGCVIAVAFFAVRRLLDSVAAEGAIATAS